MKGMIWNSEGFGDPAKHFRVQETIREQKLDFLALVETRRSNFAAPFLKGLLGVWITFGTVFHPMGALAVFSLVLMRLLYPFRIL